MRIGIELRQIIPGACGGIVPLLQGVFAALVAHHPDCHFDLFCTEANTTLFPSLPPHVCLDVLPLEDYFPRLDRLAVKRRLDVLFRSYPWDEPIGYPPERQIWLIPDLQHEFFPDFFDPAILRKRRECFNKVMSEGTAIATLSDDARRTIRSHPATRCTDIFLMGPALVETVAEPLTQQEKTQIPEVEYLLYPGNLWPHKNHRRTLQAFQFFLHRVNRPFELVLTGHPEGWPSLAAEFPDLPVRHLGFVRRALLQELLRRARALSFFSLFEGFGMPVLEAFHAGTPVACSNTTSLPEVGGDAVLSCDPTDVQAMSAALLRVVDDESLRQRLVQRGTQRLSLFRWQDSAARFVDACQRIVARSGGAEEVPAQAIDHFRHLLRQSERDRDARLDMIYQLDSIVKENQAASLDAINRLDSESSLRLEAIHRLDTLLQQSEADRAVQRALVQELYAELHSTRALARRLFRRVMDKAWRTARSTIRRDAA